MIVVAGVLTWGSHTQAKPHYTVTYPAGYRSWTHVKTALIGPQSPFFSRYGGIHHIYANEKAVRGYRTGHFPDGAVIVFDLLETQESAGITAEGSRKFIDVMAKDSARFADTGGWGYEEFEGDSETERSLTAQAKAACSMCHMNQKDHDYVFSVFRK
jgi:Cytochrome P460